MVGGCQPREPLGSLGVRRDVRVGRPGQAPVGTTQDRVVAADRNPQEVERVNNTSVLVGKLKTGNKAPTGYGSQLDVTIPPLQAGAIARFTTTVKNGKYVQARCKKKNMKFQAITKFSNFPTATDDFSSKCKQK